jgi:hypothetical protein
VTVTDKAGMQGDATIRNPNPVLCVSDGQCNGVQRRWREWGYVDPWGRRDIRALQDRAGLLNSRQQQMTTKLDYCLNVAFLSTTESTSRYGMTQLLLTPISTSAVCAHQSSRNPRQHSVPVIPFNSTALRWCRIGGA